MNNFSEAWSGLMERFKKISFCLVSAFGLGLHGSIAFGQGDASYCNLGERTEIEGCQVKGESRSDSSGKCARSCNAAAPPGYIISNYKTHRFNDQNNTSYSISKVPEDFSFDYKKEMEDVLSVALSAAAKKGSAELSAAVNQEIRSLERFAEEMSSSHALVRLEVSTPKPAFAQPKNLIDIAVTLSIQCIMPPNLESLLFEKYGL